MISPSHIEFIKLYMPELVLRIKEQFFLVGISVTLALLIGIPIGILISRTPRLKQWVLTISSAIWTIPSLALLAFLLPFVGIGMRPAIIALTLYALLPILRNTVTGIETVSSDALEAADGLGFTSFQRLWMVECPLALPVIVSGIRTATIICVGIATLAAFIGAGGLGDFINRGLATNNTNLVLLGAIPAALMALSLDGLIGLGEKIISEKKSKPGLVTKKRVAYASIILIFCAPLLSYTFHNIIFKTGQEKIRVASKNFTESMILSELMAQMIEAKTTLKVERKFNLGTTDIAHQAMIKGEIDIYPEYTGTAYLTVLKKPAHLVNQFHAAKQSLFTMVNKEYNQKYAITWLSPFGFENNQGLTVNRDFAKKHNLHTLSELSIIAPTLTIAAPAEFLQRADGMPGLKNAYQLKFKSIKSMDPGLMYQALRQKDVDVIMAFTTDGRIPEYHLAILKDDKQFFPPYDAAPLIRNKVLEQHPEIADALKPLAGAIDEKTMQQLNFEVDVKGQSVKQVVKHFLKTLNHPEYFDHSS